jgi:hypothetical protein
VTPLAANRVLLLTTALLQFWLQAELNQAYRTSNLPHYQKEYAELKQLFGRLDLNGDGTVSFSELQKALRGAAASLGPGLAKDEDTLRFHVQVRLLLLLLPPLLQQTRPPSALPGKLRNLLLWGK